MPEKDEGLKKARIRTGAVIGCDFHYSKWKDDGEIFTVKDFSCEGRKKLVADGYGSKKHYGNGAIYAKEEDLIYVNDNQPDEGLLLRKPESSHSCTRHCMGDRHHTKDCVACAYEKGASDQRKRIVDFLKKQGAVWVDKNYAIIEAIEKGE